MHLDLSHPTTSALLLLDFAAEKGVSAEMVLRGSRLTTADLAKPGAEITGGEELQLIANTVTALGNQPALALDMGVRYHLTAYGIWGFALMSSPTVRAAFETGLRYLDLTYSYLDIQMTQLGDEVWLTIDASQVQPALRRFLIERDVAALATIQRELFVGSLLPIRIELALPAPDSLEPYIRVLGLAPQFGASANRLVFNAHTFDQPLPQASPLAAQLAEAQCRQLLTQRRARSGMAAKVRDALLQGVGGRLPDIETIASQLNLTSRTLRRRLTLEGTSYRALLEELRQTLADALLGTAGMKVAEVASRLGYSEPASFLHARKRWRDQLSPPRT